MKLDLTKGYFLTYIDGVLYSVEAIQFEGKTMVLKRKGHILPVTFEEVPEIQWVSTG